MLDTESVCLLSIDTSKTLDSGWQVSAGMTLPSLLLAWLSTVHCEQCFCIFYRKSTDSSLQSTQKLSVNTQNVCLSAAMQGRTLSVVKLGAKTESSMALRFSGQIPVFLNPDCAFPTVVAASYDGVSTEKNSALDKVSPALSGTSQTTLIPVRFQTFKITNISWLQKLCAMW